MEIVLHTVRACYEYLVFRKTADKALGKRSGAIGIAALFVNDRFN